MLLKQSLEICGQTMNVDTNFLRGIYNLPHHRAATFQDVGMCEGYEKLIAHGLDELLVRFGWICSGGCDRIAYMRFAWNATGRT